MNWKLVAAAIATGLVSTFTDWLFMGVLSHERYYKYPDVWWPNACGETRRILFSSGLAFVTAAALVMGYSVRFVIASVTCAAIAA